MDKLSSSAIGSVLLHSPLTLSLVPSAELKVEVTSSRNDALCVAHALSVQFHNFPIAVEEWKFVFSSEFLDSGLFRGEVINFPAINRKEAT